MNTWKILRAQDRVNAARSKLKDWHNPPNRIICPVGMNSRKFEGLIQKIESLELYIEQQIIAGLQPKITINK